MVYEMQKEKALKCPECDITFIDIKLLDALNLVRKREKQYLWKLIKMRQMTHSDSDKPLLDGYLTLSNKQVDDIDKLLE